MSEKWHGFVSGHNGNPEFCKFCGEPEQSWRHERPAASADGMREALEMAAREVDKLHEYEPVNCKHICLCATAIRALAAASASAPAAAGKLWTDSEWESFSAQERHRINLAFQGGLDAAATAERPAGTPDCAHCSAGLRLEYRTVKMPEPYGGTGWWHWSPEAVWAGKEERGAWFACAAQPPAPKLDAGAHQHSDACYRGSNSVETLTCGKPATPGETPQLIDASEAPSPNEEFLRDLEGWLAHSRKHKLVHVCIPCDVMDAVLRRLRRPIQQTWTTTGEVGDEIIVTTATGTHVYRRAAAQKESGS